MCVRKLCYYSFHTHTLTHSHSHTLTHRLLASKNLPAAIEDTSGSELPESIREKAEAVQAAGGIDSIDQMFYNLPDLLQTNREILDEVGAVCECVSV